MEEGFKLTLVMPRKRGVGWGVGWGFCWNVFGGGGSKRGRTGR